MDASGYMKNWLRSTTLLYAAKELVIFNSLHSLDSCVILLHARTQLSAVGRS